MGTRHKHWDRLTVFMWQAYTQSRKVKLDLFEKRLEIYEDLENILLKMTSCRAVTEEERNITLLRCMSRSRFLLDSDVENFVMDVITRCDEYMKLMAQYEDQPDRNEQIYYSHVNTAAWNDLTIFLYPLFKRYLSFVRRGDSTHPAYKLAEAIRARLGRLVVPWNRIGDYVPNRRHQPDGRKLR